MAEKPLDPRRAHKLVFDRGISPESFAHESNAHKKDDGPADHAAHSLYHGAKVKKKTYMEKRKKAAEGGTDAAPNKAEAAKKAGPTGQAEKDEEPNKSEDAKKTEAAKAEELTKKEEAAKKAVADGLAKKAAAVGLL